MIKLRLPLPGPQPSRSANIRAVPTAIGEGFRGPDGRLGYLLRQAQHALWLALEDALRPLGITAAGFGVLRLVEVEPGASGADLAFDSMYRPQATHEMLVALETAGLVERPADARDKRRRRVYLTPRGAEVLAEAHRRAIAIEERMMAGLTEPERCQFRTWLAQAAAALDPAQEGQPPNSGRPPELRPGR
jgi:DNA-binding MarR family transcriptional regulator